VRASPLDRDSILTLPLGYFFETLENKAYAHRRKVAEKRKEQSRRGYKENPNPEKVGARAEGLRGGRKTPTLLEPL
jgi:hypothetical protein